MAFRMRLDNKAMRHTRLLLPVWQDGRICFWRDALSGQSPARIRLNNRYAKYRAEPRRADPVV